MVDEKRVSLYGRGREVELKSSGAGVARGEEMRLGSRIQVIRKGLALILRERIHAFAQVFQNTWELWLVRAEAWRAWKNHDAQQAAMPQHHYLDASEPVSYEVSLRAIETARINRRARRLGVMIPDHHYEKLVAPLDGEYKYCLTQEGLAEVLPRIREVSRQRRQEIGYWISLLTGLVGSLIGLLAILGE